MAIKIPDKNGSGAMSNIVAAINYVAANEKEATWQI
jgi:hypothetical protein